MFLNYEACPRCVGIGRDNRRDNLGRYSDGSLHCFSCGYHRFPKHYSVPEVKPNVSKSLLPADFTREVPTKALQWLLQYGLPYQYWKESIGYSPRDERLVFTVSNQFSIGRYVGANIETLAKSKQPRKWYVWGDSHKHCEIVGDGTVVVLVEDLISAHKVGQVATAIPLFGTRVHPCHLYFLLNDTRPVVLWLDKDQELQVRSRALQLESLINRPVKVITTDKDPKAISFQEIANKLKELNEVV